MRRNMLTHPILPSLRDDEYLAMGYDAVRGAVRLVTTESGAGESAAAWDYCVRRGFVAGDRRGADRGVLWKTAREK